MLARTRLTQLQGLYQASALFPVRASSTAPHKWVGLQNDQDFFEKNAKLKRPLSSHLTIYKFPLPAMLSVLHRGTGAATALGVSCGSVALALSGSDLPTVVNAIAALDIPSPVIFGAKFIVAFPFVYHTANGIRHLVWDAGMNLDSIAAVYKSAYITLAVSSTLTAALAFL